MSKAMHDAPIAFHRAYARLTGSVTSGLLLSQATYWSKRVPQERNGWFYKTQTEWEDETTMSRREQETARKILRQFPFWHEELRGVPAKMWFRVDFDELESSLTGMSENANPVCTNPPYKDAENRHAITKTTTETTDKDYLHSKSSLSSYVSLSSLDNWIEETLIQHPEWRQPLDEMVQHRKPTLPSKYKQAILIDWIDRDFTPPPRKKTREEEYEAFKQRCRDNPLPEPPKKKMSKIAIHPDDAGGVAWLATEEGKRMGVLVERKR